jgi:peptidyl-tRNA hydrolase, PTH1 family
MKLVVGLGNPGAEYRETRHNVGFEVVDELARRGARWIQWRRVVRGARGPTRGAAPVLLAKPLTFMNLSGRRWRAGGFFKIDPADVLVVVDDVALPLGRLRARRGGSDGGHNGLRSVIAVAGHPGLSPAANRGGAGRRPTGASAARDG